MAYRNPILNFASKNPLVAVLAVPVLMHLGGRAIAMGIRTAKYDKPLAAIMPAQASDDKLRNLGYTGGGTAPSDMIQPATHTPNNRYDRKASTSAFIDDPNYKTHKPNWSIVKSPVYNPANNMAFEHRDSDGIDVGLAGSRHSVFNGLSGVHKLNY